MSLVFFFNDTATTEIYTLSLHDALPISLRVGDPGPPALRHHQSRGRRGASPLDRGVAREGVPDVALVLLDQLAELRVDRKSTRLNSSHANISYAVFCLKKKTIAPAPTSP